MEHQVEGGGAGPSGVLLCSHRLSEHEDGDTPLHTAAKTGDVSLVHLLLDLGAGVNLMNKKGQTALHIAASRGYLDIVSLLLEQNVDVNVLDGEGYTPMFLAAEKGRTELVEMLTDKKGDVNYVNNGISILYGAASNSMYDCCVALRRLGAEWSSQDFKRAVLKDDVKLLDLITEIGGINLNNRDNDGNTAVHWAAEAGNEAAVSWLLNHGMDPNAKALDDSTPLHFAAGKGQLPVVQLLLDRGADVNFTTRDRYTPLIAAAIGGHLHVIKLLLERGADSNLSAIDIPL